MIESLVKAIRQHRGEFRCVEIHGSARKTVHFHDRCIPAVGPTALPIQSLTEFYSSIEQLRLYEDPVTEEAAFEIAPPSQWPILLDDFGAWLDGLSDAEAEECLPDWIRECATVGEIPGSGNYLLVPLSGPEAGSVFQFDHDGFEFTKLGESLSEFVGSCLDLDPLRLVGVASHMRFIERDLGIQWWIEELVDNRGNRVSTEA